MKHRFLGIHRQENKLPLICTKETCQVEGGYVNIWYNNFAILGVLISKFFSYWHLREKLGPFSSSQTFYSFNCLCRIKCGLVLAPKYLVHEIEAFLVGSFPSSCSLLVIHMPSNVWSTTISKYYAVTLFLIKAAVSVFLVPQRTQRSAFPAFPTEPVGSCTYKKTFFFLSLWGWPNTRMDFLERLCSPHPWRYLKFIWT